MSVSYVVILKLRLKCNISPRVLPLHSIIMLGAMLMRASQQDKQSIESATLMCW